MTLDEFKSALASSEPPTGLSGPLLGLWREANGDWNAAHEAVQDDPSADASWVHAYLHRREGDEGNASYWYARAGRRKPACALDEEWSRIAGELLAR